MYVRPERQACKLLALKPKRLNLDHQTTFILVAIFFLISIFLQKI